MQCTICNHKTDLWFDQQFNINYHYCPNCQLIQLDPSDEISFQEERAIYDTHQNSIEDNGYVNFFRNFLALGVCPFKQSGSLLDFGSGPEPVLVQLINRDYPYTSHHYDLHYSPEKTYQKQKFDIIVSTEVLEHVNHPLPFMKHLVEYLEDDGIISIMTLFHSDNQDHFMDWWYRRDETHITFYTPKTLEVLAQECGLALIYHDDKRVATFKKL